MKYSLLIVGIMAIKLSLSQVNWTSDHNDLRQYDYVPQIPMGALQQNLQYKQQVYDQRLGQINQHVTYCRNLISDMNESDGVFYTNSLNKTINTINQSDIFDTSFYYSVMDWFNQQENIMVKRLNSYR